MGSIGQKSLEYLLSENEKRVLRSFVKEIREKLGNEILDIRLFGSKARGDFKEDSDIDIFILVKKKKARDKISDIAADYFFKTNIPLTPVVYSLFEYKKNRELGSFFFENVKKEGIAL
jgi:predicted nucleotidyltransferase